MTGKPLLAIDDLVVTYETDDGTVEALNGVTFEVHRGRTLGLVGETGAGKTTTALSIMRLIPDPPGKVKKGQILLEGTDLFELPEREMEKIRGGTVSMIFQDPMTALNPVITVGDQIAEAIAIHEKLGNDKARQKARTMLETVGIPGERMDEYPHQFSGGMKQRVVIAIALSCNPKLLIADEPTTALDVTIQAQVLTLMKQLKDEFQMSMLMITHDLGVVAEVCDEVAIMYAGRIVEQGSLEDIFRRTKHPYTEGLFNSIPDIDDRRNKLKPIRGLMSDPYNLPPGCPFYDRCDYALDRCEKTPAPIVTFGETHGVACHLYVVDREFTLERLKKRGEDHA